MIESCGVQRRTSQREQTGGRSQEFGVATNILICIEINFYHHCVYTHFYTFKIIGYCLPDYQASYVLHLLLNLHCHHKPYIFYHV